METSRDNLDLETLPADIKALVLAERAARKEAENRAGRLKKQNGQLEEQNGQLEEHAKRLEHLLAEARVFRIFKTRIGTPTTRSKACRTRRPR